MGSGQGFNAYLIRPTWAPFYATGSIKKVDGKWGIAITKSHYQDHRSKSASPSMAMAQNHSLEANEALGPRGIIRYATLDEYKAEPGLRATKARATRRPTWGRRMFPNWTYTENAWGMSIDMN